MIEGGRSRRGLLAAVPAAVACLPARGLAGPGDAATRITAEYYDLHLLALYAVLAIFAAVFAVMLLSMRAHRRAAAQADGPFHRSAFVELLWSLVPWAILFGTAWPATAIVSRAASPAHADITIRATGLQWKWAYEYVDGEGEGISFYANVYSPRRTATGAPPGEGADYALDVDNPVVVPVGKRIRVELVANEEIHSWHVPDLGVKQYAVPGLARDTWFLARQAGTYRGICSAEACGAGRACVLVVVKAVSDADYRRWVAARRGNLTASRQ
ncbi:MAG: cytochrome c oxidase subunit II transmembrane domain-containing protein [Burkholderiales bacterium]